MSIWENFISLNSDVEPKFNVLRPASEYLEVDARRAEWGELNFQEALKNDVYPLPEIKDREGYYGQDHFSYWASGLRDAEMLLEAARTYGVAVRRVESFGISGYSILTFARWAVTSTGCMWNGVTHFCQVIVWFSKTTRFPAFRCRMRAWT